MRRLISTMLLLFSLLLAPALSRAETRALLTACSDFVTHPDLGSSLSGNLHMIGSAFLGVTPHLSGLSIEDGTLATPQALSASIADAFQDADEDDLSILYLCTHGVSSSDDRKTYLVLSDGNEETLLTSECLYNMLAPIQGQKLLILDACFSGGFITEPFWSDSSVHVLTSSAAHEAGWYYSSEQLSTGAVSYFASALSVGLGLYGSAEADVNGDALVSLTEIHRYLNMAVPSSSSQLLSASPDRLVMPVVAKPMLSRPLSGFSYGESLLYADDPVFSFSFTVAEETAVKYRLIDFDNGSWNWENAKEFWDAGENGSQQLSPGRKTRTLTLGNVADEDSGYLMLQIFSFSDEELILCSERLIAVQPAHSDAQLSLSVAPSRTHTVPISIALSIPAEITVSVHDQEGLLVRRLCQSQLTRPAPNSVTHIVWDGRDREGKLAPAGQYTVTAEAIIGGVRQKAAVNALLSAP